MEKKILDILCDIRPDSDFENSENFVEDGLLDSFDLMELIQRLEEEFEIQINLGDLEFEQVSSVEEIIKLIG